MQFYTATRCGCVEFSFAYSFARLDLDGLALGVQDEAGGGAYLGDYHALSRLQARDTDLAIFVCSVDAVAVAHYGTVRVGHLKLRVLEGDGGVDGADLQTLNVP